jgi:protein phosphatase
MRRVIDCHPLGGSPLDELQTAWIDDPEAAASEASFHSDLATVATPYLALQADFFPTVPELHNIIETPDQIILLIEDRSQWQHLSTVWHMPLQSPLQHIQWLFELTLLWEALTPWNAQASLLNAANLIIDKHNLLCLGQLKVATDSSKASLTLLGHVLLETFINSQSKPLASLKDLITELASGHITEPSELKQRLADLAEHEHSAQHDNLSHGGSDTPLSPPDLSDDDSSYTVNISNGDEEGDGAIWNDEDAAWDYSSIETNTEDSNINSIAELPTMVLPMKLDRLDEAGLSHVGQQRNHNEDYFFSQIKSVKVRDLDGPTLDAWGIFILCDGMGGHACGEVASQLAVSTLKDFFDQHWQSETGLPDEATLKRAVAQANQAIFDLNQSNASSGHNRMGTTLVMLLICNLGAAVVHVGDSRLYTYTKRLGLQQMTVDHEVGQREIKRGVEPAIAYARPDAYQLTQALGPRRSKDLRPGVTFLEMSEDTLFLLCSDGLSDHNLLENHASDYIAPLLSSKANLDDGLGQLIDLANDKNGHDNITAIIARLKLKPDMSELPC